ncbi:NAD-dependent protein deacylase [Coprothermobacteraceae bacterium]|nr:NAD-dependent protein deacylase [Coprothermobacteraceae bacterium]
MSAELDRVLDLLKNSHKTVALTGAGISTESGIPDYRGPHGLWRSVDPMKCVSVDTLRSDPWLFWRFNLPRWLEYASARPNAAHYLLASMEAAKLLDCIVTQNIDGLHRKAGSSKVYEVHGNVERVYCTRCHARYPMAEAYEQLQQDRLPTCTCGGLLRPEVVLFGDPMPEAFYAALEEVESAELMIVMGSSLQVYPVASLPDLVPHLVIVNLEPTSYDERADAVLRMSTGQFARELAERLGLDLGTGERGDADENTNHKR